MTTTLNIADKEAVRESVRENYGKIAVENRSCCGPTCCNGIPGSPADKLGYSADDTQSVPEGSNLGLGCGNPLAIASLRPGQTALDLGSGAGFDCFLAAKAVGPSGKIIGVDMTPEMIAKAHKTRQKAVTRTSSFESARSSTCLLRIHRWTPCAPNRDAAGVYRGPDRGRKTPEMPT